MSVVDTLTQYGLIRAQGRDARSFLHSQLSQDVASLGEGELRLAAYLNPKGRVLALLSVFAAEDALWLCLPRSQIAATLERLRRFVLRAQVQLDDVSDAYLLRPELPVQPPGAAPHCSGDAQGYRLQLHGTPARVLHITPLGATHASGSQAGLSGVAVSAWLLAGIRGGIPEVHCGTTEHFLAQDLNLDRIAAVNFEKGCYPGQEIVARMHYLGKPKRRLQRIAFSGPPPAPGTGLILATHPDRDSGEIVYAAATVKSGADGGADDSEALAVMAADPADRQDLHLGAADGPAVRALDETAA